MALDTPINRSVLTTIFPDLASDANFKILSDCTPVYNCIAWAMGYNDRWVTPVMGVGCWWPDGALRSEAPDALLQAFQMEGFEISDNCLIEDGYSKVALYMSVDGSKWTHAARLVTNDIEYSKFGQFFDGHHSHDMLCRTGIGLERLSYGKVFAYMQRANQTKQSQTQSPSGGMSVNSGNLAKLRALLGK